MGGREGEKHRVGAEGSYIVTHSTEELKYRLGITRRGEEVWPPAAATGTLPGDEGHWGTQRKTKQQHKEDKQFGTMVRGIQGKKTNCNDEKD